MAHENQPTPSFIKQLFRRKTRVPKVDLEAEADRALDEALTHLSRALNDNRLATAGVRRRQSSGSLKLLSLPEPSYEASE